MPEAASEHSTAQNHRPADAVGATSDPARAAGSPRSAPSPLIRIGLVLFAIGLLAVAVIIVLFFSGVHDLPLWANLVAGLAPVGFGFALVGIFRDARRSSRSRPVA